MVSVCSVYTCSFKIGRPLADVHCSFVPLANGLIVEAHTGRVRPRDPGDFYDSTFSVSLREDQVRGVYEVPTRGHIRSYAEIRRMFPDVCDFILPMFLNDLSQFRSFQIVLAYLICGGDFSNKLLFILYGPFGNNAKSTLLRILQRVCNGGHGDGTEGRFWNTCSSEHVVACKNAQGSFKDEKKSWLKKATVSRVVELGEGEKDGIFIGSVVRTLASGCDEVEFRDLYESFTTGTAIAKWVYPTNHFPGFDPNETAVVARLYPIPFYGVFLKPNDYEDEKKTRAREKRPGEAVFVNAQNRLEHPTWYRDTPPSSPGADDGLKISLYAKEDPAMKERWASNPAMMEQLLLFILDGARLLHDVDLYGGRLDGKRTVMHECWGSVLQQKEVENDYLGGLLDRKLEIVGWTPENKNEPDKVPRKTRGHDPLADRRVKFSSLYPEYALMMKGKHEAALDETNFSKNAEAYLSRRAEELRAQTNNPFLRVKCLNATNSKRLADRVIVGVRMRQEEMQQAVSVGDRNGGLPSSPDPVADPGAGVINNQQIADEEALNSAAEYWLD